MLAFQILASPEEAQGGRTLIAPDIAICPDCLHELVNPGNLRYTYPFINCTNCGPRYTIIKERPYDRKRTTMAEFKLCYHCAASYHNPADRRFHAEPVACPLCGPSVMLLWGFALGEVSEAESGAKALREAGKLLKRGKIIAVKGLGGFHLACDAQNPVAVATLRRRKERGQKPFALMAGSVEGIRRVAEVSPKEEELLCAPAAPIVILRAKQEPEISPALAPSVRPAGRRGRRPQQDQAGISPALAPSVSPGLATYGFMLPYTPLHVLLLEQSPPYLVMTSANLSGQPLIYQNEEAVDELVGIADAILYHDRDIYHPCDDSVIQVVGGEAAFLRRARGYVPLPIALPAACPRPVVALGGDLHNTFCLAEGQEAFLSPHIGDLQVYETLLHFEQEYASFQDVTGVRPEVMVRDKHPGYALSHWQPVAQTLTVQHHLAHLAAVVGEYGLEFPVGGLVLDGTGYGDDGMIWGCEFICGKPGAWRRAGHLEYLPLPGGDEGARYPKRLAYAYSWALGAEVPGSGASNYVTSEEAQALEAQLRLGVNVFYTSSAGRLFDAMSGLLGVCELVTYEGQAAIELENRATLYAEDAQSAVFREGLWQEGRRRLLYGHDSAELGCFRFRPDEADILIFEVGDMWRRFCTWMAAGRATGELAWVFHLSLAVSLVEAALLLNKNDHRLPLGGGVWQNRLLTEMLMELAQEAGLTVYYPRQLPPGDGGLSYGQTVCYVNGEQ
jgi:hydrogenase maturation protein HypF